MNAGAPARSPVPTRRMPSRSCSRRNSNGNGSATFRDISDKLNISFEINAEYYFLEAEKSSVDEIEVVDELEGHIVRGRNDATVNPSYYEEAKILLANLETTKEIKDQKKQKEKTKDDTKRGRKGNKKTETKSKHGTSKQTRNKRRTKKEKQNDVKGSIKDGAVNTISSSLCMPTLDMLAENTHKVEESYGENPSAKNIQKEQKHDESPLTNEKRDQRLESKQDRQDEMPCNILSKTDNNSDILNDEVDHDYELSQQKKEPNKSNKRTYTSRYNNAQPARKDLGIAPKRPKLSPNGWASTEHSYQKMAEVSVVTSPCSILNTKHIRVLDFGYNTVGQQDISGAITMERQKDTSVTDTVERQQAISGEDIMERQKDTSVTDTIEGRYDRNNEPLDLMSRSLQRLQEVVNTTVIDATPDTRCGSLRKANLSDTESSSLKTGGTEGGHITLIATDGHPYNVLLSHIIVTNEGNKTSATDVNHIPETSHNNMEDREEHVTTSANDLDQLEVLNSIGDSGVSADDNEEVVRTGQLVKRRIDSDEEEPDAGGNAVSDTSMDYEVINVCDTSEDINVCDVSVETKSPSVLHAEEDTMPTPVAKLAMSKEGLSRIVNLSKRFGSNSHHGFAMTMEVDKTFESDQLDQSSGEVVKIPESMHYTHPLPGKLARVVPQSPMKLGKGSMVVTPIKAKSTGSLPPSSRAVNGESLVSSVEVTNDPHANIVKESASHINSAQKYPEVYPQRAVTAIPINPHNHHSSNGTITSPINQSDDVLFIVPNKDTVIPITPKKFRTTRQRTSQKGELRESPIQVCLTKNYIQDTCLSPSPSTPETTSPSLPIIYEERVTRTPSTRIELSLSTHVSTQSSPKVSLKPHIPVKTQQSICVSSDVSPCLPFSLPVSPKRSTALNKLSLLAKGALELQEVTNTVCIQQNRGDILVRA